MKKKLKIIIPVVLVVLIAAFVALYFFTDMFKSPKNLFFKYLTKTFQSEKNYTYDNFLEELNFYYEKACKTNVDVTLDAKLENSNSGDLDQIKNLKLSLLSQVGPKQDESYSKISLDYKNENLTSIECLNSNNNYGIKCSDIYKDYFYFENKNLKALAEKLGADSDTIPDSISKINLYDLFYISKDTRESILKRYYKVIDSELDKDNFSSEKGEEIKVNGKTIKADSYTMTLTTQDLMNILKETFRTLKDDDEALDLFLEKYNMITKDIDGAELSKEDLKNELESAIDSLNDTDSTSSGKIRITVYESKGKTVKISLKSGYDVISLDLTENKKDGIISVYAESNKETIFSMKNEYKIDGDTITGKIVVTAENKEMATVDYTFVNSNSKISFEAKMNVNDSENNVSLQFKYEITGDNLNKKPTKFDFNGYFKLVEDASDSDSDYVTVNFKGSTEYTDSIDIPDLGKSNGVCINTTTIEELEALKPDINTNLNTFVDKILSKFDITRSDVGFPEGDIDFFSEFENYSTDSDDFSTDSSDFSTNSDDFSTTLNEILSNNNYYSTTF